MPSLSIIVHLQIFKQRLSGLLMGGIELVANTLFFERAEKGLHGSVVPTISFAGHADHCTNVLQWLLIRVAGILTTSITVMDEARLGAAASHSHLQRIFSQG